MLNFTNTVDRTKVILGNKMVEVNTVLTDDKTTTPFQNVRHIPKSRHLPKPHSLFVIFVTPVHKRIPKDICE